jgi:hypothetical protein
MTTYAALINTFYYYELPILPPWFISALSRFFLIILHCFYFSLCSDSLDLSTLAKGPLDSSTKSSRPLGLTLLLALKTRVFDFDKRTKIYIYIYIYLRGLRSSLCTYVESGSRYLASPIGVGYNIL